MIAEFIEIESLFSELDKFSSGKADIFIIGGAVLLYQGLKPATKDIDIVVGSRKEFLMLKDAFEQLNFKPQIPGDEYSRMNLSEIFEREDFRIDMFHNEVCGKFALSAGMKKRAALFASLNNIRVYLCSNEDVFLFKAMTEREGDLEDCISLAKEGIEWQVVLDELNDQMKRSRQDVWVTWVGERLDILEDKGVSISIMPDINRIRDEYFERL